MDGRVTNMNTYIDSPRATEIIKLNFNFLLLPKNKSLNVFSFIWIALYYVYNCSNKFAHITFA